MSLLLLTFVIFFLFGQITYGSVLKLAHEKTKFRLHSHDVPYGSGSGQQSVTGFPNVDDSNSYWVSPLLALSLSAFFCLFYHLSSLLFRFNYSCHKKVC